SYSHKLGSGPVWSGLRFKPVQVLVGNSIVTLLTIMCYAASSLGALQLAIKLQTWLLASVMVPMQSTVTSSLWPGSCQERSQALQGQGEGQARQCSQEDLEPRLSRRQERQVLTQTPHKLAQLTPGMLTGTSAHMSPHRSCFQSYGPSSMLVEVANGQVVKAAVGSVEFHPVDLDGKKLAPVLASYTSSSIKTFFLF
ncbi:hypothetical protein DL93DRAFT_2202703, partial [Clavulina sp. PMI_390]